MHPLLEQQIREHWGDSPMLGKMRRLIEVIDHTYDSKEQSQRRIENSLAELSMELTERNGVLQRELAIRSAAEEQLQREKAEQKKLISRLEETHNKLLQSEKMASIGQLAAGVAHEINNPIGFVNSNLSSLKGYVDDLLAVIESLRQALDDPNQKENATKKLQEADLDYLSEDVLALLNESQDGIQRVRRIVQDLKDFSHVDQGEWGWTDLHRGLDSTLNIVNNEIKYKATVHKQYSEIPQLFCQASQLNQVFMNLLVNAAHAIEERGDIFLSTQTLSLFDKPWISVEIRDTGKGIPEENLNRIFDPFFTTKPVGQGTGLGLSLSYGIVQKHRGRIEVESELDVGTTFRVLLPLETPAVESLSPNRTGGKE
ncbi:ATP-binding protein [Parvibium lacunae]|uniref:histidine kinase n=1 Tax=Parvibium lacunae TaxID=1888893 RepID=A0A368L6H4_9BURK|nr:ATP-binding protein [Parvibium lacunae]RCS59214.1 histidine kinase [Parvibium lacunae]